MIPGFSLCRFLVRRSLQEEHCSRDVRQESGRGGGGGGEGCPGPCWTRCEGPKIRKGIAEGGRTLLGRKRYQGSRHGGRGRGDGGDRRRDGGQSIHLSEPPGGVGGRRGGGGGSPPPP